MRELTRTSGRVVKGVLEMVVDCIIRMMLNALLENVQLPFHVLSAGAFQLILEQGPTIDQDQVEVWGDI